MSRSRLPASPTNGTSLARYTYRLTEEGVKVAMFVLFHKRVCGPLANTLFHHRPKTCPAQPAIIEAAYHTVDLAIQNLIDKVAA